MNELGDDLGSRLVSLWKESALFWELLDSPDTTVEFPTLEGKKGSSILSDQDCKMNQSKQELMKYSAQTWEVTPQTRQPVLNNSYATKVPQRDKPTWKRNVSVNREIIPVKRSASHDPSNKIVDRDKYFLILSLFSQLPGQNIRRNHQ